MPGLFPDAAVAVLERLAPAIPSNGRPVASDCAKDRRDIVSGTHLETLPLPVKVGSNPRHGSDAWRADVHLPVSVLLNQSGDRCGHGRADADDPELAVLVDFARRRGHEQVFIPGTLTTSTGPAFLQLRASASSLSASPEDLRI